ncbi:MAG: hypothetical protein ACO3SD_02235, partial [Gemmatimonadaceae bacterium]
MSRSYTRSSTRSASRVRGVTVALLAIALPLGAQGTRPVAPRDTAQARDTLEAVVIRATRRGGTAPTSQSTLDRAAIEQAFHDTHARIY